MATMDESFKCDRLRKSWRRLEREKEVLLESLKAWHQAEITTAPSSQKWSAAQVIEHLVLTEAAVLDESTSIEEQKLPTFRERLTFWIFNRAFRFPVRVKVPRSVSFLYPSEDLDFSEVCQHWESVRARWRRFLCAQACEDTRRIAMRHPVVGNISLAGSVEFLCSHLLHHRHQLKRIRTSFSQAIQ